MPPYISPIIQRWLYEIYLYKGRRKLVEDAKDMCKYFYSPSNILMINKMVGDVPILV